MKKKSKRYKEIFKSAVKDKKVDVKNALELIKKILQQNSTSQSMCHYELI